MAKVMTSFVLLILTLFSSIILADEMKSKPRVPYYAWGQCIGEGCGVTNGHDVEISNKANVYSERSLKSKVKFQLNSGDKVKGVSQLVVVHKLGVVKVLHSYVAEVGQPDKKGDYKLRKIQFEAGDIIYELHPISEGFGLYWYKGVLFDEDMSANRNVKVISDSVFDEWQKIENKKGQIGWTKNLPYWGERA